MQLSQHFLLMAALISLACLQIEACLPAIIAPIAAVVGGSYAAGRSRGEQRENSRPDNVMKGCFADSPHSRDMGKVALEDDKMTKLLCKDRCKQDNKKYMGLQGGTQCFCSDEYNKGGKKEIPNTKCDKPCGGDDRQPCGGVYANTVYYV